MRNTVVLLGLLAAAAAHAQDGSTTCVAAIRASLRDPESMRLVRVTRYPDPFALDVAGQQRQVRGYEVVVNAKNAFGGYVGNQGWMCTVDAANERLLVTLVPPPG